MKRIIALVMSALMLLTTVPVLGVFASDTSVFVVDAVEGGPGETVTVNVSTKNNSGVVSMKVKVSYDANVLELVSAVGKDFEGTAFGPLTLNPVVINWVDTIHPNNTTDGVVATLTFRILDTAAGGKSDIILTYDEDDVYDSNYENVKFGVEDGSVIVKYPSVAVTGVTIDETLSLKTGETKTPGYTVNPAEATNKAVLFKSNNTAVATVNETTGEVTGVKKGTTTITITTADGNFTDTCVVTVSCSHANKTTVSEKASDCKNQGWDAYVKCNDCGQLFAENGTIEITEIPFRPLSQQHTGGTATCTKQAVCTVCNQSYGNLASHSFTATEKKTEALKTEGNCRDNAVYYYSCSACGKVENNDSHTFLGDKVAGTHVGGTTTVNAAEPNHETQVDGYTGDTKCLGCNTIISYGQPIPVGAHTPANVWSNDGEYHWKECIIVGCGIVIDGSKAAHSSTGANVATCNEKAVCDVCDVSYGDFAVHDCNTTAWEKDVSGHWHKCNTTGCTEKNDFAGHTPDHQGGATEEYPIKCTVCGWIIEQQHAHNHVFDQEVVDELYLASKANCTDPAKYYKSCRCGEKGTETFENGRVSDHTEGTEWKSDADNHWHICIVAGCGVVIESSKAAHTPDREEATETDPIKCSVCGYEIVPALGHTHAHGTEWKSDKDNHWNECACGDKTNIAAHKDENTDGKCDVCEYNADIPADPSNPQTGDNSMISLWIILLCVSALGIIVTTVLSKKKSFR